MFCIFAGLILKRKTMTVVSRKEFNTNQERYFDLAKEEQIFIRNGKNMFHLTYAPFEMQYPEQKILEPDDDLRRAITIDELRERTYEVIDRFFANK